MGDDNEPCRWALRVMWKNMQQRYFDGRKQWWAVQVPYHEHERKREGPEAL